MNTVRFNLDEFVNARFYHHFLSNGNTPLAEYVSVEFRCLCECTFETNANGDLIWQATFPDAIQAKKFRDSF